MSNLKSVQHPGKLLLSEITKLGMKQKELAIRTGVSEKHISTIINGTKDISVSFARKLDIALGAKNGTWAKYQADYDQYMVFFEEENHITTDEISILKSLKDIVEHFLNVGIIHNHCDDREKIIQLRRILRVNNLSVIPQITYNASYRAQINKSTNINPYVLFAWQRMCEIKTEKAEIYIPFDGEKLTYNLPKIKKQMFESDPPTMLENLKSIFAECGVTFDVVHHFRGAPVQGFIKQTDSGQVILCLTIRGRNADRFWFSLFHEVGHLLNGDLCTRFIDFDSVPSEIENNADSFARDTLINPAHYKKMLVAGNYHDLAYIKRFAEYEGVPYWIVIGRLHSDEWLDWSCFAHETPKFVWNND